MQLWPTPTTHILIHTTFTGCDAGGVQTIGSTSVFQSTQPSQVVTANMPNSQSHFSFTNQTYCTTFPLHYTTHPTSFKHNLSYFGANLPGILCSLTVRTKIFTCRLYSPGPPRHTHFLHPPAAPATFRFHYTLSASSPHRLSLIPLSDTKQITSSLFIPFNSMIFSVSFFSSPGLHRASMGFPSFPSFSWKM